MHTVLLQSSKQPLTAMSTANCNDVSSSGTRSVVCHTLGHVLYNSPQVSQYLISKSACPAVPAFTVMYMCLRVCGCVNVLAHPFFWFPRLCAPPSMIHRTTSPSIFLRACVRACVRARKALRLRLRVYVVPLPRYLLRVRGTRMHEQPSHTCTHTHSKNLRVSPFFPFSLASCNCFFFFERERAWD